ncbi:hypothetical protein FRE64_01200 [Euhalothece natronophila Z-M001]|uniref:Uncharacterized protein n=1 Tax=Euhalothece natronophila Z-M001 TaxID=522448 RepID=A0A5B8NKP0_9CHRO|nr:hypothetical protein [Euhalothece natronophila]QDZ38679.1 hypothetical protein FRE64_01200 [Euhalothece natronophila Z-M001]
MARRITRAQQTFNEVLQALDTEILEAPPDSLLIIRGVIAEAVEVTALLEEDNAGLVFGQTESMILVFMVLLMKA